MNKLTVNPVSDNSVDSLNMMIVDLNQIINDLVQEVAKLKGTDGFTSSISSDLDLGGNRIKNVGSSQLNTDVISRREFDRDGITRKKGQEYYSADAPIRAEAGLQVPRGVSPRDAVNMEQLGESGEGNRIRVGRIIMTRSNSSPGINLGYGTWALVLQGKFPVGFKSGDPDFGVGAATGGAKTHKHSIDVPSTTSGAPSATATVDKNLDALTVAVASGTHTHDTDPAAFDSDDISNLNPFEVVYFWERTA
jgi:hypothetical protein